MTSDHKLQKFQRTIREEGITNTTRKVVSYCRRLTTDTLEGTPGYYNTRLWLLKTQYNSEDITPIWVSPNDVSYLTGKYQERDYGHLDYVPYFKPIEANWDQISYEQEVPYGVTIGGSWDEYTDKFTRLVMHKGISQRYCEDYSWVETDYYKQLHSRFVKQGWSREDAANLSMKRCDYIESVYHSMTTEGYQSQRSLRGNPLHEVTVNVARDGTLLYNSEGRHRLSIAKTLDIDEIPVIILVQHDQYQNSH